MQGSASAVKRAAALLAVYALVLALVSFAEIPRKADMWLVGRSGLLGEAPPLDENLVIVIVPLGDANAMEKDRQSIAALLQRLVRIPKDKQPDKVVLDIEISEDTRGLKALEKAIEQLRQAGIEFYAAANPDEKPDPKNYRAHKAAFYSDIDGVGHTLIHSQSNVLWYDAQYETGDGTFVAALPAVVALGQQEAGFERGERLIRVGAEPERDRRAWAFDPGGNEGQELRALGGQTASPDLEDKTVVIGTLDRAHDFNNQAQHLGLDLLAWAISDRISVDHYRKVWVLQGPGWVVGATLLMSLVTAGVFRGLFRALPSQRQRLWLLGSVSAVVAVLLFAGIVLALHAAGSLYPQWSLVLAGIAVAIGLTGYALHARLLIDALKLDMENAERVAADQYDVFISYSRTPENLKWVSENLYPALAAARRADGAPLRVFFDKRSIFVGTSWYEKIAVAIQGSRFFVPVYSQDYFQKGFCRFEIELAAIKRVQKPDFILPLARLTTGVPPGYQQINFIDVSERPDFVAVVLETVSDAPKPA